MQLPIGDRPIGQRELAETQARGAVVDKIKRSEGRWLVVWSPQECKAMKELLERLRKLEGEE